MKWRYRGEKQQEILKGLDKGLANELLAYIDIPARLPV